MPERFFAETHLDVVTENPRGSPVRFALSSGERLCVRGNNGSGKTTLLSALAGQPSNPNHPPMLRRYNTRSIVGQDSEFQAAIHWLGHRPGLGQALSIAEEWRFWYAMLATHTPNAPCPLAKIAGHVELDRPLDQAVETLSVGEKQKVALARLFLAPRAIWLLDEPDSHLDTASRNTLAGWMATHCAEGGLIVDCSHCTPSGGTTLWLDAKE
ncbi:MAG: ATP-binding cassette domain-containing protein [Alphaproteobacteria bacterium]|nr:ATP-binding cassette domain-containing protein [Alphaproteobacteria bacterium]